MKVIFGTTNDRKAEDLMNQAKKMKMDLNVLSMNDIGWDLGEIDENGSTIEENSLIKAKAIFDFCSKKGISLPIITDDAGLFVDALNGEPGIYTARYADAERKQNPELPKYQGVIKLLDKLKKEDNRNAAYRCKVTCMLPDGTYFQSAGESKGKIAEEIIGELKKPYFYSVFVLDGQDKPFNALTPDELETSYRYTALKNILIELQEREKQEDFER